VSFALEVPTDALGVSHAPAPAGSKIACLVPSLTELLLDLGLRQQLVARTGFCVHPADRVQGIAKVGGTKDVQLARLRALAPDYVVLDIDENTRPTAEALKAFVRQQVVTHPCTLRDNLSLFSLFGNLFSATPGVLERAQAMHAQLSQQLALALRPNLSARVLYLIWQNPWMTVSADTYIADVLTYAGAQVLGPTAQAQSARRYPAFKLNQIDWRCCDAVLLSSEPFSFTQAHALQLQQEILGLSGRSIPCHLVDGERLSWYGSRSLKSLEYCGQLHQMLHGG
jgi:ABC-type Fe3+-hydroxamate transport system substrate-binding protein